MYRCQFSHTPCGHFCLIIILTAVSPLPLERELDPTKKYPTPLTHMFFPKNIKNPIQECSEHCKHILVFAFFPATSQFQIANTSPEVHSHGVTTHGNNPF